MILFGALAQLGERLPCTQEVTGSIPVGSTIPTVDINQALSRMLSRKAYRLELLL